MCNNGSRQTIFNASYLLKPPTTPMIRKLKPSIIKKVTKNLKKLILNIILFSYYNILAIYHKTL